jgi:uncharacterized protein (DUF2132 family)
VTLEQLRTELVAHDGWRELARRIDIRRFMFDPNFKSSLVHLWLTKERVRQIYNEIKGRQRAHLKHGFEA